MQPVLILVLAITAVNASPLQQKSQKRFLKFTDFTDTLQQQLQGALKTVFNLPNVLLHNFAPSTPSPEQLTNLEMSTPGESEIII